MNYLNTIFKYYTECNNEYEFERIQIELLLRHKNKIEEMLYTYRKNIRVWDKYVWTANYHNYFCHLNFPDEKQLQIPRKNLLSWPSQVLNADF